MREQSTTDIACSYYLLPRYISVGVAWYIKWSNLERQKIIVADLLTANTVRTLTIKLHNHAVVEGWNEAGTLHPVAAYHEREYGERGVELHEYMSGFDWGWIQIFHTPFHFPLQSNKHMKE